MRAREQCHHYMYPRLNLASSESLSHDSQAAVGRQTKSRTEKGYLQCLHGVQLGAAPGAQIRRDIRGTPPTGCEPNCPVGDASSKEHRSRPDGHGAARHLVSRGAQHLRCATAKVRLQSRNAPWRSMFLESFAGRTRRRGCCSCCKMCARAAQLVPLPRRAAAVISHLSYAFCSHGSSHAGMCCSWMSCSACPRMRHVLSTRGRSRQTRTAGCRWTARGPERVA